MDVFPNDLIEYILKMCDTKTILRLKMMNSTWRREASEVLRLKINSTLQFMAHTSVSKYNCGPDSKRIVQMIQKYEDRKEEKSVIVYQCASCFAEVFGVAECELCGTFQDVNLFHVP